MLNSRLKSVCSVWIVATTVLITALACHADESTKSAERLVRFIDQQMTEKWRSQQLVPSARSSDAEFLRRASLDINGTIPSADVVRAFLADKSKNKRQQVVEQWLKSKAYSRHYSTVWANLLVGRGATPGERLAQTVFRSWLEKQLAANTPFSTISHSILTATGAAIQKPEVYWTLHHSGSPEELTGAAARVFLGTQIQCAQCHDHPFDDWKQTDFYGMAAFFGRVKVVGKVAIMEMPLGDVRLGGMNDAPVVAPKYLDGTAPTTLGLVSRRPKLAEWITSTKNKQFARAITNRYWSQFFGRGLVDPVDDMGDNNPAVYPDVLDQLADGFIASGYDVKFLIRTITQTRAYHLSSLPSRTNKDDVQFFSKAHLRRMNPEELIASIVMSMGLGSNEKLVDNPLFQLLLEGVKKDFIFVFGNMDESIEVSEFRGTIAQALLMMNSQHMDRVTNWSPLAPLSLKLRQCRTIEEQIEWLYLSTLSRPPTRTEARTLGGYFRGAVNMNQRLEICEDIYWALLNSSEFSFNH